MGRVVSERRFGLPDRWELSLFTEIWTLLQEQVEWSVKGGSDFLIGENWIFSQRFEPCHRNRWSGQWLEGRTSWSVRPSTTLERPGWLWMSWRRTEMVTAHLAAYPQWHIEMVATHFAAYVQEEGRPKSSESRKRGSLQPNATLSHLEWFFIMMG